MKRTLIFFLSGIVGLVGLADSQVKVPPAPLMNETLPLSRAIEVAATDSAGTLLPRQRNTLALADGPQRLRSIAHSESVATGSFVDARAYGPVGTKAAIDAALTAIGSKKNTLSLAPGTWAIAENLTIPANVTLKLESGAVLSLATTKTLTIQGGLEAGLQPIFSWTGTGKIVFGTGSIAEVYPEWWGAVGNGGTDCTAAIQAAVYANPAVCLNKGTYKITASIQLAQHSKFYGKGWDSVLYQATPYIQGIKLHHDCLVRDLKIQGQYAHYEGKRENNSTGLAAYYQGHDYAHRGNSDAEWKGCRVVLENCQVVDWGFNGMGLGPQTIVKSCRIEHCWNEGIIMGGDHCQILNNFIKDTVSWGIDTNNSYTDIIGNQLHNVGYPSKGPWGYDSGGICIACGPTGNANGIKNIRILNNLIDTSSSTAIWVGNGDGENKKAPMSGIEIQGNKIFNVWNGIWVGNYSHNADDLVNVDILSNVVDRVAHGDGIAITSCSHTTIQRNTIRNISKGKSIVNAMGWVVPTGVTIRDNIVD